MLTCKVGQFYEKGARAWRHNRRRNRAARLDRHFRIGRRRWRPCPVNCNR